MTTSTETVTRPVYVVSFDPTEESASPVGGWDWYETFEAAHERYEAIVKDDDYEGDRITVWNAYPVAGWTNEAVTDYLADEFADLDALPGLPILANYDADPEPAHEAGYEAYADWCERNDREAYDAIEWAQVSA